MILISTGVPGVVATATGSNVLTVEITFQTPSTLVQAPVICFQAVFTLTQALLLSFHELPTLIKLRKFLVKTINVTSLTLRRGYKSLIANFFRF